FKGNARMLMHHVLHDEPKAPRKIDPKIPNDLETICLRAMAKEPKHRYATAGEFRDDLRRWLNGEPIRARPVVRLERAVKWVRRRPETAALIGLLVIIAVGAIAVGAGVWQREEKPRVVAPVPKVQRTDVELLFDALVKPLMKIECTLPPDAPMHVG